MAAGVPGDDGAPDPPIGPLPVSWHLGGRSRAIATAGSGAAASVEAAPRAVSSGWWRRGPPAAVPETLLDDAGGSPNAACSRSRLVGRSSATRARQASHRDIWVGWKWRAEGRLAEAAGDRTTARRGDAITRSCAIVVRLSKARACRASVQ
jgi:hypothetical protein